jgi:superfamily II DNA or RNA helicase
MDSFDEEHTELIWLREENHRLKEYLLRNGIAWSPQSNTILKTESVLERANPTKPTSNSISTQEKVALFRTLFQGREDVFARRWESANGKSGYSPVCVNEWKVGLCGKPSIKCVSCENRKLLPITDYIVFDHLVGKHVIGLYPLLPGDTCKLLAIDFDEGDWRKDSLAFVSSCHNLSVSCSLEISRSGMGAHVWIFFASAIPARDARSLGYALISHTCSKIRQLELSSYDRLFPNQDRIPSGGFGNLIALPLQKDAREHGGSVFVDDDFKPWPDQWAYLASLVPTSVESIIDITSVAAEGRHPLDVAFAYEDNDKPWRHKEKVNDTLPGPLPVHLDIVISDRIYLVKEQLTQPLLNRVIRLAAFSNPEYYKAQALRLSVWDTPRIIGCAENYPCHIALPRGCRDGVLRLLHENDIEACISDERTNGTNIEVSFTGQLRPEQDEAIDAMLEQDFGVLCAPTGFGKTIVAAAIIARRGLSTLVLVHRTELLRQWKERLQTFLKLATPGVGLIGGGKNKPGGIVDVAVIQTLSRRENLQELLDRYGQVIVDECHHVSAVSFERVLKSAKCKYIVGLTATPFRRDGQDPIIFMQCGSIRHTVARSSLPAQGMEVRLGEPPARSYSAAAGIQEIFGLLSKDEARNIYICKDIIDAYREGRKIIVLTERKEHLELLRALLEPLASLLFVLHGKMSRKQRSAAIEQLDALPEGEPRILLATGKLVGEGFDHASLDTLVLTMPISWKGTLQQYAGRLNRICASKHDLRIYDYIERDEPRLARMWAKRERGYKAMGYRIRRKDQVELRQDALVTTDVELIR